jgi:hypothetical protein
VNLEKENKVRAAIFAVTMHIKDDVRCEVFGRQLFATSHLKQKVGFVAVRDAFSKLTQLKRIETADPHVGKEVVEARAFFEMFRSALLFSMTGVENRMREFPGESFEAYRDILSVDQYLAMENRCATLTKEYREAIEKSNADDFIMYLQHLTALGV